MPESGSAIAGDDGLGDWIGRPRPVLISSGKGGAPARRFERDRYPRGFRALAVALPGFGMQDTLVEWLRTNNLERFAAVFEENGIDLETVGLLTDRDLEELGLPLGPRRRILAAIRETRAGEASRAGAAVSGAPVGERRQLTVLFCDVVDSTALFHALDPETLQVVFRAYEEACDRCIRRYEGSVLSFLGDGVVALFGFPLAHENEAGRAIRAGLDIVDAVARLELPIPRVQVRIGVATGIVVVWSEQGSAVGDTMNLASRLQTIAEPGSIVVSDRTRRLAGDEFAFRDLGDQELKGITSPSRVYRVLGVSEAESRFDAATRRGTTQMIGREAELDALFEAWRRVT